ncbi:MAG: hypothetical protein IPM48_14375, partial [Saprospiraceae bacterium]|nr:hypothetical protein [Saprospiraceae bacterium]
MKKIVLTREMKIKYILSHPELSYEELGKELGMKPESVRGFCKRNKLPNKRINSQSTRTGERLPDMVKRVLEKEKKTVVELADVFDVSPKKIIDAISELKAMNLIVDEVGDSIKLAREIQPNEEPLVIDFKKYREIEYPIGFVTDNHIGSKYERLDVLNAL